MRRLLHWGAMSVLAAGFVLLAQRTIVLHQLNGWMSDTLEASHADLGYDIAKSRIFDADLYQQIGGSSTSGSGELILLFVLSGSSEVGVQALDKWTQSFPADTAIWVAATSDFEPQVTLAIERIAQSGKPYKLLRIARPTEYSVVTGLRLQPAAVVATRGRLSCAVFGLPPSDAVIRDCAESSRGGGERVRAQIRIFGSPQPLLAGPAGATTAITR